MWRAANTNTVMLFMAHNMVCFSLVAHVAGLGSTGAACSLACADSC
jgi:hypothetical protein